MEQFIQYLYEYENGERARNLGFMKVEPKMDKVEIQIYSKQLDDVFGIWFRKPDGTCYIAAWENPDECASTLAGAEMQKMEVQEPQDVERISLWDQKSREKGPEAPAESEMELTESAAEWSNPEDTYIPPSTRTFEKIQRQDLSRLPRKEWRIANNNFLLHGYYNYHHLLFIKDEGKMWLGVPGIYHEREKMAAESFGFPEFIRLTDYEMELSEEEKNTAEDFGYWCRQVEHF